MLHNSFYHFVNNLYYILKCFCLYTNTLIIYNNKSNVNSLSTCYENKALCSQESNGTFRLQNNTLCKLQYVAFSTTFKHKHGGKVNKHFWEISFKNFENERNLKICKHAFSCTFKSFRVHGYELARNFSS